MTELLLVVGMALVTFAVRYPVMVLVGRLPLPESLFRALRYVPPAVLAAIIVPGIVMPAGRIDLSPTNTYLVAGVAAGLVAWRTKNILLTIVIGMGLFLFLRLVVFGV
ncbi:MAG: AzlD domain-containing protein [bacterium]|nr:AzlD domain-containing protein [bacterium]